MVWDLFCRVVDNFGDVGVCWRLAAGLAARGESVRLWIDDASALTWMAPRGTEGVQPLLWADAEHAEPADTVIEAFGCDPPSAFIARMARRTAAPVWINLEYLSAEAYVERSHGLQSPQLSGPGAGLNKWFFYPGFNARTGGLLRGTSAPPCPEHWLAQHGWARQAQEQVVVLFCYDTTALPDLLQQLAAQPTLLLAAPGPAQQALSQIRPPTGVRTIALPWLAQTEFDQLLHCTDLNLVRGEDSFVQAQWPGVPFIWQLYPQADGAHAAKLEAFLDRFLSLTEFVDGPALRQAWRAWNGLGAWPERLPPRAAWQQAATAWRDSLRRQPDLITQLQSFVAERR